MTIIEAINRVDSLIPNNYSREVKINWLSILDGIIKNEIIDTHEGASGVVFNKYTDDTPLDTVLLAPFPYDDIYVYFLESRIHYSNEEYDEYNNAVTMYNAMYTDYANYYNKTHIPNKGSNKRFIF